MHLCILHVCILSKGRPYQWACVNQSLEMLHGPRIPTTKNITFSTIWCLHWTSLWVYNLNSCHDFLLFS